MRPLLPDIVPEKEFVDLIDACVKAGAMGIIFGAFWIDPEGVVAAGLPFRAKDMLVQKETVNWSPHGMNWNRCEDKDLVARLMECCRSRSIPAFDSSADAVRYLNDLERD